MMDEDKICPLCGKEKDINNSFCDSCREIAKNEFPSFFNHRNEDETTPQEIAFIAEELSEKGYIIPAVSTKRKYRKQLFFASIIGISLLFGIGAFVFYKYQEQEERIRVEREFWNKCIDTNTPIAYSTYLQQYPKGEYKDDAELRIRSIREAEMNAWNRVVKSSDLSAFFSFLEDHPNSPYERLARIKVDSLAWLSAKADNTKDAYKAYLDNVGLGIYEGKFLVMAQERYDYLSQLKTLENRELEAIYDHLSKIADLISTSQFSKAEKFFIKDKLSLNDEPTTYQKYISIFRDNVKKNKIKSILYSIDKDSISAILDNKGFTFVELSISKKTIYIARSKKTTVEHIKMSLQLDKDLMVETINITEK